MGIQHEDDARRVMAVLPKRFAQYGLTLHPDKTRLVRFEPPRAPGSADSDCAEPPGTFDFPGFTHYWGKSRVGTWVVKRKTARSRFRRGLHALSAWCRQNRHRPIAEQHATICQKLLGHFAYYGITGNSVALGRYRTSATWIWKRWLSRRRRGGWCSWDWIAQLQRRYPLPPALAIHSLCRPAASS